MKKFIIRCSILLVLFNSINALFKQTTIQAKSVELSSTYDKNSNSIIYSNGDIVLLKEQELVENREAITSRILVGWIADGTLIYATGHSGGEWVARSWQYISEHPNASEVHLSDYGCSLNPIHSQFGCH
ncbi:hypothetical protein [Granulicatella elegans]|uniref:hypothetical protein n=1 Tax=Granulicatella elegans TaxID=137732 RepID=UPI001D15341E|nr:hypothetical protein [Granulicatella elegans]UEA32238.1 hypothetical protein LK443_04730 [Granulicatella elegans]